ncbi:MAG TPA: ATP-binding cassette domain-containing protein [Saprospiraceae bacterium]|nr:ABC transporter ATP-binding protein [Saprospirales bacterium]HRQ30001.1 ATP-binding cassette domain-containing protein [Saprospiraceae bacterium]
MIRAKKIYKSFGDLKILDGIDFTFEKRKTNLIIGQSGAGKTVLLKILVGLLEPSSGEVWYDQINCMGLNKKERRQLSMSVGMLFQGSALFDSMSVEENIRFPLDMFTNFTDGEKRLRIDYCLNRVELKGVNKKYPSELSGGMQKRVGIARAIVLKPKYLFCDEPNSGLDPKTAIVIDDLIKDITIEEDMTTVINTHDMNSVMEIGDNILLLNKGKMEWTGHKDEILASQNQYLSDFIFASPFLKQLKERAFQGI